MDEESPDLSIVCPSCGATVSPYITECPYCGGRLRKRAPRIGSREDPARIAEKKARRRRPRDSFGADHRPLAVPLLVAASVVASAFVRGGALRAAKVEVAGHLGGDWWKLLTTAFIHRDVACGFVVLVGFAIFGSLLERRRGSTSILLLWFSSAAAAGWVASVTTIEPSAGALAPAFAAVVAWGVIAVIRRRDDPDVDLVGAAVAAVVLLLLPVFVLDTGWQQLAAGALVGGAFAGLDVLASRRSS